MRRRLTTVAIFFFASGSTMGCQPSPSPESSEFELSVELGDTRRFECVRTESGAYVAAGVCELPSSRTMRWVPRREGIRNDDDDVWFERCPVGEGCHKGSLRTIREEVVADDDGQPVLVRSCELIATPGVYSGNCEPWDPWMNERTTWTVADGRVYTVGRCEWHYDPDTGTLGPPSGVPFNSSGVIGHDPFVDAPH